MPNKQQPVVKKVKPYPIAAVLEVNAVKKPLEIQHLTLDGVRAHLTGPLVFVGEYYQLRFEIPVSHKEIVAQVRVLKTYDKAINPKEHKIERFAELYFQNLTEPQKNAIGAFLSAIGQVK